MFGIADQLLKKAVRLDGCRMVIIDGPKILRWLDLDLDQKRFFNG